jgi:hypothetical protein
MSVEGSDETEFDQLHLILFNQQHQHHHGSSDRQSEGIERHRNQRGYTKEENRTKMMIKVRVCPPPSIGFGYQLTRIDIDGEGSKLYRTDG